MIPVELIPLNCNHCGGKLKVGADTRFVTCKHCDTQLAVRHEDGAAFTDVIEAARRVEASAQAIEAHAERLSDQNERVILQGELERLDREWERRGRELMTRNKRGELQVPTRNHAFALAAISPLMLAPMLVVHVGSSELEVPGVFWILMLAMVVAVLFAATRVHARAAAYERALAQHEAERDEIEGKLSALLAAGPHDRPKKQKKQKKQPATA